MIIDNLPKNKKIILFDGVCNLCNNKINYIIDKDKNDTFRFAAIQSEIGQQIIKYLGIPKTIDSVILYVPNYAYYTKGEAVFLIVNELQTKLKYFFFLNIFPNFIKNYIYDFVAKNRYNWFGKLESCKIPTPEIKNKFL